MATQPQPPNKQHQLPRLQDGTRHMTFQRAHMMDGTIPVYWGPDQPAPSPAPNLQHVTEQQYYDYAIADGETPDDATLAASQSYANEQIENQAVIGLATATADLYSKPSQVPDAAGNIYSPPGDWPNAGTLVRTPRVARWFWEAADITTQCTIVAGYSGTYSYGQHYITNYVDATGPAGTYPVHTHTRTLDQYGTEAYGLQFTLLSSGYKAVPNDNPFVFTGAYGYWVYAAYIPPFILEEYEDRSSLTYYGIELIWDQLVAGFLPFQPYTFLGAGDTPINFTQTPDQTLGLCLPVLTGVIYINGNSYGTEKDLTTVGMTIPDGWAQPPYPASPYTNEQVWQIVTAELGVTYGNSTNPYFDSFDVSNTGILDDFLEIVTPILPSYFGTRVVNFLLFATYHPIPSLTDPRILRIKDQYKNFPSYNVVVLLDMDNFAKLATVNATGFDSAALLAFPDAITAFVEAMGPWGWQLAQVGHNDPEGATATIASLIHELLPPEPIDAYPSLNQDPEEMRT